MKKTVTIALAISLLPAAAVAQATSASTQVKAGAQVEAGRATRADASVDAGASATAPSPTMSPEARARIDAMIAAAAGRGLPAEPLRERLAEGEAKGASEAQITAALARIEANMQTTQRVFARLGREASEGEIAAGAEVVAEGATEAQLSRVVERADKARGLEVALTTLASLSANGEGVANAITRIEAKLAEGASDHAIAALASAHGAAHSAHGAAAIGAGAAAGRAGAAVGAGAAATGAVGGAGAAVGGAAGGVIRAGAGKP